MGQVKIVVLDSGCTLESPRHFDISWNDFNLISPEWNLSTNIKKVIVFER